MTGSRDGRARRALRRDLPALLLTVGLGWLVYLVVFNFRLGESDYHDHLSWAVRLTGQDILDSAFNGRAQLWHVCMRLVMALGVSNIWKAAALVTAIADAAAFLLVYRIWDRLLPEKTSRWLLAVAAVCAFLASSLTLPGHSFYTGRGAVNTWQNPTNIMVRPFAAAALYMTVDIYDRRRGIAHPLRLDGTCPALTFSGGFWAQFEKPVFTRAQVVLYPLCLLFSVYAKPSFLQVFAPAMVFFLLADLIRSRGMLFPFCLKLALAFLPAGLLVLRQFGVFFGEGFTVAAQAAEAVRAPILYTGNETAGVSVYYLENGWTGLGPFLQTSWYYVKIVLLPCAFPLFLLAAAPRRMWRCTGFRLALACVAAGLLEAMFLHETGERSWHGNFTWGLYLSCWLLWTSAVGPFAALWSNRGAAGRWARWGGAGLLAWQTACGCAYLAAIFREAYYYF